MSLCTSHIAHLENGIDYFYNDSGAPNTGNYTTLLIAHGTGFTTETFNRLYEYAPAMNLRIVALSRRDYPGTTKYSDQELEDWNSAKEIAWDRLATQLGQFLEHFIKKENIPQITEDRANGGITIIGWSQGCSFTTTLFRDRKLIPHDFLEPYVKDVILYDPPFTAIGAPIPEDAEFQKIYLPWLNLEKKPMDEVVRNFAVWVSSYFDNPPNPKSVNDLPFGKRGEVATTDSLTPAQWKTHLCVEGAARSETTTERLGVPMKRSADAMFLNVSKPDAVFPKAHVTYISATRTPWTMWWPYLETVQQYKERRANEEDVRRMVFVQVEGGNHFVHWDAPQTFLEAVVLGMNAKDEEGEIHRVQQT